MQAISELKKYEAPINYQSDKDKIKKFILFYMENGAFKYLERLGTMKESIEIELDDLAVFDETGLAGRFQQNAFSYLQLTAKIIDDILYNDSEELPANMDAFFYHRIARFKEKFPERKATEAFPSFLLRNYTVVARPLSSSRPLAIREVKAEHIGRLLNVRGIITRVSMVKPSMRVATYICESCGSETYQEINTDAFDLLEECASEKCRTRNVKGTLTLLTRGSKFLKYQSLQLQELTSDVPRGSIPRSMRVECYSNAAEACHPGEFVVVAGMFLPRPYHGMRKLKAGLLNDTFLQATHIVGCADVSGGNGADAGMNGNTNASINNIINDIISNGINNNISINNTFSMELLVDNFAPEIYGMRDVKKILLLMLAGAPTLEKGDGMRIRGDINVLLMGDPGIAKSQLLKTVVKISQRGIYTTGRGSSSAGLTASVTKDAVTGEVVLEGGALVLSDRGVCCIDELDKMSDVDRVSIHEVMEQQRVSISKAGINTTLNARCAVLGAANPTRGRYDPRRTLEQNVGLPCSLLSRFDVLCVLKDDPDADHDMDMASHITALHFDEQPESVDYAHIRAYIAAAREVVPVLGAQLKERLVSAYLAARRESSLTTPRMLLSLVRLALAHARLHMRAAVTAADVDQAIAMLELMKVPRARTEAGLSMKHTIYNFIISLATASGEHKAVRLEELWEKSPFDRERVEDVISDFASSGIWMRNNEELIIFN